MHKIKRTLWKWNNKTCFKQTSLDSNYENNQRSKWEFLEYEIWKFTIRYSKIKAKLRREENSFLEIKTKEFRAKLNQWKKNSNEIYEMYQIYIWIKWSI